MSGMFAPKAIPAPSVTAPAPMPDSESPAVRDAKRRAELATMSRAGRTSTILSPPKPVGDTYSAKALGSDA